ncbi:MAG TPA: MauE/DoxX family redox-associated membrane protein [Streptomyces sp.]|jgi:hypothetical protein|nr:MauE/DoxX family redox-associated membrane protein [Streptomyces sp.]
MLSTTSSLAPVLLAVLLGRTGAVKLFSARTAQQAPRTALARMLRSSERATHVLLGTGLAELVIAAGLLAFPASPVPGAAAALLGAGFVGYLGYARAVAPESSCGCSANESAPITWRAFARAGLVLAGGAAAASASTVWWVTAWERPATSAAVTALGAAALVVLSVDLDRWWLLPLRRTRLRLLGHPLTGTSAGTTRVPAAATVELLENSLAWQAASPVVRSGLLDHWEEDGWRFLLYSGVHEDHKGALPVSVVFALDVTASRDTSGEPAVRVSVVGADTGQPVDAGLAAAAQPRTVLPVVS